MYTRIVIFVFQVSLYLNGLSTAKHLSQPMIIAHTELLVKREKQYRINTLLNHYLHKQYRINILVYQTIIYIRGVSSSRSACGLYKEITTACSYHSRSHHWTVHI